MGQNCRSFTFQFLVMEARNNVTPTVRLTPPTMVKDEGDVSMMLRRRLKFSDAATRTQASRKSLMPKPSWPLSINPTVMVMLLTGRISQFRNSPFTMQKLTELSIEKPADTPSVKHTYTGTGPRG